LQMGQQFYGLMGTLPAVVKTGDAPDYAKWFSDPAEADRYTTAQHNGSMATAKQLTKRVDITGIKSLLDVGGGSGAWSITLARANEALHAKVLELPEVCVTGRRFVAAEAGTVPSRVEFLSGSCIDSWPAEAGNDHDAVLMSYVSGSVPASLVPILYKNAFERVRPGGMLIVHDFMVDDSMDGPMLGALWAAQHVTVNAEGVGLMPAIVKDAMAKAGFGDFQQMEMIKGLTKTIIGKKA